MALYYGAICVLTYMDARVTHVLDALLLCEMMLCLVLLWNNIKSRYYQGLIVILFAIGIGLAATVWRMVYIEMNLAAIITNTIAQVLITAIMVFRYALVKVMLWEATALSAKGDQYE